MKRVLLTLVVLGVTLCAMAQSENPIVIDLKSFRPVQTDALTGVNIDPIGVDSSRRPCARIKMRVSRMTAEDIKGLDVKIITNNQLIKCKTAEYDNGLIIEMTAKPDTRFYLYHPRLGYSNEVTVNLEANKEYRLDTYLNQQLSISVQTDIAGADVYLDDIFRGQTNSDNSFVIHDVVPGVHKLRVEYADKRAEQVVNVSNDRLSFPIDVLTAQSITTSESKPSANNYNYEVRVRKISTHTDRRKSFEQSVTAGINPVFLEGKSHFSYSINYVLGYRTAYNLFFGVGTGVLLCPNNTTSYYYYTSKVSVPLYANMKVYMSISDCQPFVSLSAGGMLSKTSSLMAEPSVGIDFRRSDKLSINIQAGCMFYSWANTDWDKRYLAVAPSLKFGLTF